MVHLLSERNYGTVIGCHWLGAFCGGGWDENYAFGMSRINYSDNLSLSTNLIDCPNGARPSPASAVVASLIPILGHGWGLRVIVPMVTLAYGVPAGGMNPRHHHQHSTKGDFDPDETIPTIVAFRRNAWRTTVLNVPVNQLQVHRHAANRGGGIYNDGSLWQHRPRKQHLLHNTAGEPAGCTTSTTAARPSAVRPGNSAGDHGGGMHNEWQQPDPDQLRLCHGSILLLAGMGRGLRREEQPELETCAGCGEANSGNPVPRP